MAPDPWRYVCANPDCRSHVILFRPSGQYYYCDECQESHDECYDKQRDRLVQQRHGVTAQ